MKDSGYRGQLEIRKLPQEEHGRTRTLYETVFFQDEAPFVDYYYTWKTRENVIYTAEDQTGIHAMLHLNPVKVRWNGEEGILYYIVAVATENEYRHQGWMRRLLLQSMQELREEKAPFVFLMPASEAIYTPFGFRRAWEWRWEDEAVLAHQKVLRAAGWESEKDVRRTEEISQKKEENWKPLRECTNQQLERLSKAVNQALGERFCLFTDRTPEYYRNLEREQQASGGCLEVLMEREGAGCEEREVCARCTARETFPPMMIRILHLESFLKQVRTEEKKVFFWQVEDELLPENNGFYEIRLSPQGGSAYRREPDGTIEFSKAAIEEIPNLLGGDNPFLHTMICEVV